MNNYFDFHLNGLPKYKRQYVDGKLQGDYKMWYNNGILFMSAYFKDDKKDGEYILYNPDGTVKFRAIYKDDIEQKSTSYSNYGNSNQVVSTSTSSSIQNDKMITTTTYLYADGRSESKTEITRI